MANTTILLREDIDALGGRGEIVKVKAGYARNYLLPQGLATLATKGNVKQIERERELLLKKAANERATADAQADKMRSLVLTFERKAGEQGALYGSVTSMDIAEELQKRGYEVDRHRLHLREPLKRLGDFTVPLRLHREVTVDLQIKVAPEGELIVGHMTAEQEAEMSKQTEAAQTDEGDQAEE